VSDVQKICCKCGVNVAHAKRVKDAKGRYYCQPCYDQAAAGKGLSSTAPAAASAPAVAVAPIAPAPVAPPPPPPPPAAIATSDSGELELAEPILPKKAPADEPKLACASCKKIFPEKQARIEDGEFLCPACFAKRKGGGAVTPVKQKIAAPAPSDGEVIADVAMSLGKQLLFVAVAAVAAWFVMAIFMVMWPEVDPEEEFTMLGALVQASVYWFFILVQSVGLIGSMIITAKIVGGIEFGTLGMAFMKAILVSMALFALELAGPHMGDSGAMLLWGFRPGILLLGFMAVFRIDFFEAMILSFVNMAIGFVVFIMAAITAAIVLQAISGVVAP